MTLFQLLMLCASAFFAFKVYEHIQTLQQPQQNSKDDDVTDVSSLMDEADAKMSEGDFNKALIIYKEANYQQKDNPDILFKIAYSLMQQDRDEEALEYLNDALKLDKTSTAIYQALASTYRKLGNFEMAKNSLNSSISIDGSNPITYYNYGNLLVDEKEFEEAKKMYKKALELDPDFKEAQEELSKI